MELSEVAVIARSLNEFAERMLPSIARMTNSSLALLYIADSRLLAPLFFQCGFEAEVDSEVERRCAEQFERISSQADLQPTSISFPADSEGAVSLLSYPLWDKEKCIGLIGLGLREDVTLDSSVPWERLLNLLTNMVSRFAENAKSERQLAHLNAYLTVSSLLAQSLGLHSLLEAALYSCLEVVSAEAASVLLLDDEKENFTFYQVEGPSKPVLKTATFPADKGIAGAVLQALQSEVANDVQHDPRFYGKIDSESGFQTRNMIAAPLVAGEERIGVLELLNKIGSNPFTEEDRMVLVSIAEVIAFAIRNTKIFEYVADTYCKQRQGQASCKGCKRPLGSWTPCVKYREVEV
ncbi:GAF domain-containing protein [Chloroflexota bacterium]